MFNFFIANFGTIRYFHVLKKKILGGAKKNEILFFDLLNQLIRKSKGGIKTWRGIQKLRGCKVLLLFKLLK